MSRYTMELKTVCEMLVGLQEPIKPSQFASLIEQARPLIFDFDYPIFDQNYKKLLETKILKHFFFYEIGCSPLGKWKILLDDKLNLIMPYYNQLYSSELLVFEPFTDVDLTTSHDKTSNSNDDLNRTRDRTLNADEDNSVGSTIESSNDNTVSRTAKQTVKHSDTPQGTLENLENNTYMTDANIQDNSDDTSNISVYHYTNDDTETKSKTDTENETVTDKRVFSNVDEYLEHVTGKRGSASYSALLMEYRQTFINIDQMVINELNDVFMTVF